jgi:DNA uptake protein ComE-like DNA-binding protein
MKHIAWVGAVAAMLALPAMAQTLQTSPQMPTNSIPQPGKSTQPSAGTSSSRATSSASRTMSTPVNINTATAAELDALPGIGKARAAAIIKNRPYKSTDELQTRHIIPQSVYNKIKNDITARPT